MLDFKTTGISGSYSGGIGVTVRTNVQKEYVREACDTYEVSVTGIIGGYAGEGNCFFDANTLLLRILRRMKESNPISLISLDGGITRSEISREAYAQVALRYYDVARCYENKLSFEKTFEHAKAQILEEYGAAAPELQISLRKLAPEMVTSVMTTDSFYRLLNVFTLLPNGIQAMSADFPGKVSSLVNIGIVFADTDSFSISAEILGCHTGEMEEICARVSLVSSACGCDSQFFGEWSK